jgi:hypothetical protein
LLGKAASVTAQPIAVEERSIEASEEGPEGLDAWVTRATQIAFDSSAYPTIRLCIDVRAKPRRRREPPDVLRARAAIEKLAQEPQVTVRVADKFRLTPRLDACDVSQ